MTEVYDQITDHEDQALARQVWQYEDSSNFNSLIEIHAGRIQLLENALWDLLRLRAISTSSGVQLDGVGEYYQVLRNGDYDETYRARIISEINRVQKAGQVESVLSALRALSGQENVTLIQLFPATLLAHIFADNNSDVENQDIIESTMDGVKAAGVNITIGIQLNASAFIFQSDSTAGGAANTGFATLIDGSDGGNFPQLLI